MKILRGRNRVRGAGVILVIVATLAIVFAGCVIYHIYKWARRVQDNRPVPMPGITNSDSIPTPGNPMDITSAWWQDVELTFRIWDGVSALELPEPEPERQTNVLVKSYLDGSNLLLQVCLTTCIETNISFASLGMPVDENGMPNDFSWEWNKPPGEYQSWILERSTNFVDWQNVGTLQVWPGCTNGWREPLISEKQYYRARQ